MFFGDGSWWLVAGVAVAVVAVARRPAGGALISHDGRAGGYVE